MSNECNLYNDEGIVLSDSCLSFLSSNGAVSRTFVAGCRETAVSLARAKNTPQDRTGRQSGGIPTRDVTHNLQGTLAAD